MISAFLPAWIFKLPFQIAATAAVIAVLVGSCVVRDKTIENRGAAKVVTASKQLGNKANAKNMEVRRAVSKPGAAERLRAEVCRDCN